MSDEPLTAQKWECPNCGDEIDALEEVESWNCAHCGTEMHPQKIGSGSPTADDVAEIISRIGEEVSYTQNVDETLTGYMKAVVEEGEFFPGPSITTELELTPYERITGTREQDMTALFVMGLMLGAALERDVPKDSIFEDAWRNGDYEMPDDTPDVPKPEEYE